MANIKVTVDCPVYDGMVLTVKAPCNCTEITGLVVYYESVTEDTSETTSQVFTFRDAHGYTLSSTGNLFMKNSYLRVILDTTNGYAFIQNADTNEYLERKLSAILRGSSSSATVRTSQNGGVYLDGKIYYAYKGNVAHIQGDFTWDCGDYLYAGYQTYYTGLPAPEVVSKDYTEQDAPLYFSVPATFYDQFDGVWDGVALVKIENDSEGNVMLSLNNDADGCTKITYHFNNMYFIARGWVGYED